ncbi:MAG: hypothetical protein GXN92_01260 [Candidatus Micrarchaeota archaeon]|nr:hypothetical protein [Candidatus Micrarchaeota archaeon]
MNSLNKLEEVLARGEVVEVRKVNHYTPPLQPLIDHPKGWTIYKTSDPIKIEKRRFLGKTTSWVEIPIIYKENGEEKSYLLIVPREEKELALDGGTPLLARYLLLSYHQDQEILTVLREMREELSQITQLNSEREKAYYSLTITETSKLLKRLTPIFSPDKGIYVPAEIEQIRAEIKRIEKLLGDYIKRIS